MENINEDFGEVAVKDCDFCGKTCKEDMFLSVNKPSFFNKYALYMGINTSKKKEVDSGICLKCILKGLATICNNDKKVMDNYIDLLIKKDVLEKLK